MKTVTRVFSVIFAAAAVMVAAFSVYLCLTSLHAQPVLVTPPAAAEARARDMMAAVSQGDYDAAGAILYGSPKLGSLPEDAGEAEKMIWDAFVSSISYDFPRPCYASDSGIAMDVDIHSLEIGSVTANLKQRSQSLLSQRVAEAANVDEIYDEQNNYREDFVMAVLRDATAQALQEDAQYSDHAVTLHLVYEQEQWWVVPEQELLDAISGGIG